MNSLEKPGRQLAKPKPVPVHQANLSGVKKADRSSHIDACLHQHVNHPITESANRPIMSVAKQQMATEVARLIFNGVSHAC